MLDFQNVNLLQFAESSVRSLAEFVRTLPPSSNMDALVIAVFGSLEDKRAARFRQSVQYYLNGTASGFLKYGAPGKKLIYPRLYAVVNLFVCF